MKVSIDTCAVVLCSNVRFEISNGSYVQFSIAFVDSIKSFLGRRFYFDNDVIFHFTNCAINETGQKSFSLQSN